MPAKKKRVANKSPTTTSVEAGKKPPTRNKPALATGAQVVRAVRQHRHRAAVLSHLASEVQGHFMLMTTAPQYLVRWSDGSVGPADEAVVVGLALEFQERAEQEREQARKLLRQQIAGLSVDQVSVDEELADEEVDLNDETELNDGWDPSKRRSHG